MCLAILGLLAAAHRSGELCLTCISSLLIGVEASLLVLNTGSFHRPPVQVPAAQATPTAEPAGGSSSPPFSFVSDFPSVRCVLELAKLACACPCALCQMERGQCLIGELPITPHPRAFVLLCAIQVRWSLHRVDSDASEVTSGAALPRPSVPALHAEVGILGGYRWGERCHGQLWLRVQTSNASRFDMSG